MNQNILIIEEYPTGNANVYTVHSESELPKIKVTPCSPSDFYTAGDFVKLVREFGGKVKHGLLTKRYTKQKTDYIYVRDEETHIVYVNLDEYEGEAIAAKLALGGV